jgi:hypothetical protein
MAVVGLNSSAGPVLQTVVGHKRIVPKTDSRLSLDIRNIARRKPVRNRPNECLEALPTSQIQESMQCPYVKKVPVPAVVYHEPIVFDPKISAGGGVIAQCVA